MRKLIESIDQQIVSSSLIVVVTKIFQNPTISKGYNGIQLFLSLLLDHGKPRPAMVLTFLIDVVG